MNRLEEKFWNVAISLEPARALLDSTKKNLSEMKKHSDGTYLHELRVALIAKELASFCGQTDSRPEFFGGANHDVGKLAVRNNILSDGEITDQDYAEIKNHAQTGAKHLKDFYYTSLIAGLHHRHQSNGYGLAENVVKESTLSEASKIRLECAIINVSLGDYYDAATTRRNNFFGHSTTSVKVKMSENFPGYTDRIDYLFESAQIKEFMAPYQLNIDTRD